MKRAASLNPANLEKLGAKKQLGRFKRLVYSLTSRSIVKAHDGDSSIIEFQRLIENPLNQSHFRAFEVEKERLDQFFQHS